MVLSATKLREHLYSVLEQVLTTGEPVEVELKGRKLRIEASEPPRKHRLDRLVSRPGLIIGDPDELVHLDWTNEWRP